MTVKKYTQNVFINCPLDEDFKPMFRAIVFTVFDCGFIPRCALEEDDASLVRIEKIKTIISQCKYGIHDISRTELCKKTKLPRFNMPLELGLFLGAKKYGDKIQKKKICLITDKAAYRFQKFISDIAGQDIYSHNNKLNEAITIVRDWLRNSSNRTTIPGGSEIAARYRWFRSKLPDFCKEAKIKPKELTYNDYQNFVYVWLKDQGQYY